MERDGMEFAFPGSTAFATSGKVMVSAPSLIERMDQSAVVPPSILTVQTLCGRAFHIHLPTPSVSLEQLREALHAQLHIPVGALRLSVDGRTALDALDTVQVPASYQPLYMIDDTLPLPGALPSRIYTDSTPSDSLFHTTSFGQASSHIMLLHNVYGGAGGAAAGLDFKLVTTIPDAIQFRCLCAKCGIQVIACGHP
jgi:hypothetical protein